MSRLSHFLDNQLTDGGDGVGIMHPPPFSPREDSWYSFLLEAELTPGP
jgi:rRNA maturation protein Nop10